ncbi:MULTISPECIES: DinB family protein [unclassified Bacillus (in: firmicutes)]|uniref:DinB family protein n=1 Tax=unclassified Bacillus (in: firmicutes) TaxID=185979 RepID=UPI0023305BCB|nr:DinB family protein [Bacillus sp. BP-3]MDC2867080.1 DinB family protein [Bacillus sp. BP-3]
MFVQAALHQLEIAIDSTILMLEQVTYDELQQRPLENKRSLFEICTHLSLICHADFLILNESSKEELDTFYKQHTPHTLEEVQQTMIEGFQLLSKIFQAYSLTELEEVTHSYWGASYSRFEWLLEIVAHFYHHRGQLHTLLVEHVKDLLIPLFE